MSTKIKNKDLNGLLQEAKEFVNFKMKAMTMSDRVQASRIGKAIVLKINEFYKKSKDPNLMEVMKAVSLKKRKIEKRLKIRPSIYLIKYS